MSFKAKLNGFTHVLVKSGQRCFHAAWWPSEDPLVGAKEKTYPLMMMESGQCQRVNANNLKKITKDLIPV
jgi:hypothetical protein